MYKCYLPSVIFLNQEVESVFSFLQPALETPGEQRSGVSSSFVFFCSHKTLFS